MSAVTSLVGTKTVVQAAVSNRIGGTNTIAQSCLLVLAFVGGPPSDTLVPVTSQGKCEKGTCG